MCAAEAQARCRRQKDCAVRAAETEAKCHCRQDPLFTQPRPELIASTVERTLRFALPSEKASAGNDVPLALSKLITTKKALQFVLLKWKGKPTFCNKCKKSTRNAQTATIPPLKGGVDVAVGTKRRTDRKLCKSTQASLDPFMVDWWTDTADLEDLQDTSAHRRESTVPFVHGSTGRHEREQSPGVSTVHESQLDSQEGPASGSSDESLDSASFASTGLVGATYSERRAEVAVDQTILPTNVSKPVTIEFSANCPYMCAFCLTAFAHLRDLAGHVEVCPWPEPYLCGLCSKPCEDWKTTRAHMSAHVGNRLKCLFCHRRNYKLKYDLVHRHIMLHITVRQFMCGLCRSAFPTKEALRSHHSVSRWRGLSCRYSKHRPRKGNASCSRPATSTRQ